MATQTQKQISVLSMSTMAFTVCFAVWVMFSIIGIPIKAQSRSQRNPVRPARRHPHSDRLTLSPAAWHADRQGRRTHRVLRTDDEHRHPDLAHRLRNRILAISGARTLRGGGWLVLLGRHRLRCPLVYQAAPGLRHGHLRRRQRRCRCHQVRRALTGRGLWLAERAARLRRGDADHGHSVLDVYLYRYRPPCIEPHHHQATACRTEGSQCVEAVPVLLHRIRRLCRAEPVDDQVLHHRIRIQHADCCAAGRHLCAAIRRDPRHGWLAVRQGRRAHA